MKLTIHQPYDPNMPPNNKRMHNQIFNGIIKELYKIYSISLYTYSSTAMRHPATIDIGGTDLQIKNCEMCIIRPDNKIIIISYSNVIDSTAKQLEKYKGPKSIYFAHFNKNILKNVVPEENMMDYKPFFFTIFKHIDIDYFYKKRLSIEYEDQIDKMVFRGNKTIRPVIDFFDSDVLDGPNTYNTINSYLDNIVNYKVGLSIGGIGEYCYRDFEYMGLGIPMIRAEYNSKSLIPLIPNYHYIALDRDSCGLCAHKWDLRATDRISEKEYTDAITKKFKHIKDNKELLNFISYNAKQYFEQYIKIDMAIKNSVNIINKELGVFNDLTKK